MILADVTLKKLILKGQLIYPYRKMPIEEFMKNIGPASIDCTIGDVFKIPKPNNELHHLRSIEPIIDVNNEIEYDVEQKEVYIMRPRSFVLATTTEVLHLPNSISAYVEGRSSVGRAGLFVQNAGYIDPGFKGQITLELFNANDYPLKIYAFRRMCQIVFFKLDKPCGKPYAGKYKNQLNTTGSRVHLDREVR